MASEASDQILASSFTRISLDPGAVGRVERSLEVGWEGLRFAAMMVWFGRRR